MVKTNVQDAMKMIFKLRNMSYSHAAEKMGVTTQTVADRLNKKSAMSVATLLKMCEVSDCELVIRSKMKDKGEWVVTEAIAPEKVKGEEK